MKSNYVVLLTESAALEEQNNRMNAAVYAKGLYAKKSFKDILHKSSIMQDCVELAKKYAKSQSTVMIFGETGVGKEGFAQSIHNSSLNLQNLLFQLIVHCFPRVSCLRAFWLCRRSLYRSKTKWQKRSF